MLSRSRLGTTRQASSHSGLRLLPERDAQASKTNRYIESKTGVDNHACFICCTVFVEHPSSLAMATCDLSASSMALMHSLPALVEGRGEQRPYTMSRMSYELYGVTMRTPNYLFSKYDLSGALRSKQAEIGEQVGKIHREQFLATSTEDVVAHLVSKNIIEPLQFFPDRKTMEEYECKVDISQDHYRAVRDRSRPCYIDGIQIRITVPFEGDPQLWYFQGSSYTSCPPIGHVEHDGNEERGRLVFVYERPADADFSNIRREVDRAISEIERYLEWQRNDLNAYNETLPSLVADAVKRRKDKLVKQSGLSDLLGIPLKAKEGSPDFTPIKVKKKIVKPLNPIPHGGYTPEPGIEAAAYENTLNIIRHTGNSFERTPEIFKPHDEEALRDFILANLNTHYEGNARGEAFNKSGKTDILISDNGKNAFIGECKIWRGGKGFCEAVDQLLGYLTWRDCKTALVVFNKNNRDFSMILNQIQSLVEAHSSFVHFDKQLDENEWNFTMRSKDDASRTIRMRVMVFNLFCPTE